MTRLRVSDHAVLRYLERIGGFEIDRLRVEIARTVAATGRTGAGTAVIAGAAYVVRDSDTGPVITTVMTTAELRQQRRQRPPRFREASE